MTINILIIGQDIDAERMIDSLLFNERYEVSQVYSSDKHKKTYIHQYKQSELMLIDFNHFQIVFVFLASKYALKLISEMVLKKMYDGLIMVNEPLTFSEIEFRKYKDIVSKHTNFWVYYPRDFCGRFNEFPDENKYEIQIAAFKKNLKLYLYDLLPHFVNWVIRTHNQITIDKWDGNCLSGRINDKEMRVYFLNQIKNCYVINGKKFSNPDLLSYSSSINNIIGLAHDYSLVEENLNCSYKVLKIIKEIDICSLNEFY